MKDINQTIEEIKAKGYIVKAEANMWLGKLDEKCPTVYAILNPDYSTVYGAGGVGPDRLQMWADDLPDISKKADKEEAKSETMTADEIAERKEKEREYDNIYNEGGEGYNPYR